MKILRNLIIILLISIALGIVYLRVRCIPTLNTKGFTCMKIRYVNKVYILNYFDTAINNKLNLTIINDSINKLSKLESPFLDHGRSNRYSGKIYICAKEGKEFNEITFLGNDTNRIYFRGYISVGSISLVSGVFSNVILEKIVKENVIWAYMHKHGGYY